MKLFLRIGMAALIVCAAGGLHAQQTPVGHEHSHNDLSDPTFQLVFFSVLDGCFQDGLTDADVDQILRKTPNGQLEHFIYSCPICTATMYALEAYRARPDVHTMKIGGRLAFGHGLTSDLHARLYSDQIKDRLSALHDLEQNWVDRRVASLRLDPEEAAQMQKGLKAARDEGTRVIQSWGKQGNLAAVAPGYQAGDECAVCNAAAGMALKLAPRN